MAFGELDAPISRRRERLRRRCGAAGIDGMLSPDIRVPLWQKFLLLVPLANLNALTRVPLGGWRGDTELLGLFEASLRETIAVGQAEGGALPADNFAQVRGTSWLMP